MEQTIGKSALIKRVAQKTRLNPEVCSQAINAFITEIIDSLSNSERIAINNFMTMEITERAARESINFKTGDKIIYPPVKSVKCKISKAVKDIVNGRMGIEDEDC